MKINIPDYVRAVLHSLESGGFCCFVVGGCVRDSALGKSALDWDIATDASPAQTTAVCGGFKVVPTGEKHGTITVISGRHNVEVTTMRTEHGYHDRRRPDSVQFIGRIEQDLARRDFTVNAMAYSEKGGLRDPFGGMADLQNRLIRAVGDPAARFAEDALRVLRAVRFASVLGFEIEAQTERAMKSSASFLPALARERCAQELSKLLCGQDAQRVMLKYPDIIGAVVPEVLPCVGFDQKNKHHIYDVWTHTCLAAGASPPRERVRLALLLHDLGKPETCTVDQFGERHFHGHAAKGEQIARQVLARLRYPRKLTEQVCALVRHHAARIKPDKKSILKWLGTLPRDLLIDLFEVERADNAAKGVGQREDKLPQLLAILEDIERGGDCYSLAQLEISGHDLLALGFCPRDIGAALDRLLALVMDGACENRREALLDVAQKFGSIK